jgi:murein DD-endopeptidase MepM/ murein hydrolase activator NlpD
MRRGFRSRLAWAAALSLAVLGACTQQPHIQSVAPLVLEPTVQGDLPAQLPPHDNAEPDQPQVEVTPLSFEFPAQLGLPVSSWRPPPYPPPWVILPSDHFYFGRPIPSGQVNWPNPQYRYGNTFFGIENVHTGVDLGAPRGTPVLAAGPGEVVWTGYGLYRGIPRRDDPYGLAIAIRHDFGYQDEVLFTAYAHLSRIDAWVGQKVELGEQIGVVGATGHATGEHLHFEVRLAENRYFATRNPELWMVPPEGWGVLAGHVLNTSGYPLREQEIQIESLDTGQLWSLWSYAETTVVPDEIYGENFVISDLRPNEHADIPWPIRFHHPQPGRTFEVGSTALVGRTDTSVGPARLSPPPPGAPYV